MRTHRRVIHLSPFLPLLVAACSGHAEPGGTPAAQGTGAATAPAAAFVPYDRIAAALPRGGSTYVAIHTVPYATCIVGDASDAAAGHMTIFADGDGIARLQLWHQDPTVERATLAAACQDEAGRRRTHAIDVMVSDDAVSQPPVPFSRAGKPTLPRLDVDPMSLTVTELMARGYPPRPDPQKSPSRYAKWLHLVTSEPTLIEPHRVADPDHTSYGPESAGNWSGYVIQTQSNSPHLYEVYGELVVPNVYVSASHPARNNNEQLGFWVGMDGYNGYGSIVETNDVIQTGIGIEARNVNGLIFAGPPFAFTQWAAPDGPSAQGVPGFVIGYQDEIEATVLEFDDCAYFYLYDVTQNEASNFMSTPKPAQATFSGRVAEWIMEWPSQLASNGQTVLAGDGLLDYGLTSVSHAEAYDVGGSTHSYYSDTSFSVSMVDDASDDMLSTPIGISPDGDEPSTVLYEWEDWN